MTVLPADSDPVEAKAILIDPATMGVLWMNESAASALPDPAPPLAEVSIAQVIPAAEAMGLPDAIRRVAEDGVARHVKTSLVSTPKGRMEVVTSIYLLPLGAVLVLADNAWEPAHKTGGDAPSRRPGRRRR